MKPGTQALRDALIIAVRQREFSTTAELIADVYTDGRARPYRYYSAVYSQLRALDNLGVITWNRWTNASRVTTWSVGPNDTGPADDLESAWEASR